ncbi:hypothetical protein GEMRC1_013036 [Eukaryota sp. GEM-RC1]
MCSLVKFILTNYAERFQNIRVKTNPNNKEGCILYIYNPTVYTHKWGCTQSISMETKNVPLELNRLLVKFFDDGGEFITMVDKLRERLEKDCEINENSLNRSILKKIIEFLVKFKSDINQTRFMKALIDHLALDRKRYVRVEDVNPKTIEFKGIENCWIHSFINGYVIVNPLAHSMEDRIKFETNPDLIRKYIITKSTNINFPKYLMANGQEHIWRTLTNPNFSPGEEDEELKNIQFVCKVFSEILTDHTINPENEKGGMWVGGYYFDSNAVYYLTYIAARGFCRSVTLQSLFTRWKIGGISWWDRFCVCI